MPYDPSDRGPARQRSRHHHGCAAAASCRAGVVARRDAPQRKSHVVDLQPGDGDRVHVGAPGDELVVNGVDGEHVVLVLDGAAVRIDHPSGAEEVSEPAVVIVPAGTSTIRVRTAGTMIRLLAATTAPHLPPGAPTPATTPSEDGNVAEFVAWPDLPSGDRIRVYRLSEHPLEEGRLGRIFRCTTVDGQRLRRGSTGRAIRRSCPRTITTTSSRCRCRSTVTTSTTCVAWTPDSSTWRDDEHRLRGPRRRRDPAAADPYQPGRR